MSFFRRRTSADDRKRPEQRFSSSGPSRTISSSSKLTTRSTNKSIYENEFKGDLGLTSLNTVSQPLVDFIFVHGLGGGSRKTWSKSSDSGDFWPQAWLPYDTAFDRVRIHSFGYDSDWDEKKKGEFNTHDFARSLLNEIENASDVGSSKSKIVLVSHSMGGAVTKKSYLIAREDPSLRHLADRIHTFYFLATPHRGSDLAKTLKTILKFTYGSKSFVDELLKDSSSIWSINDSFRHYADDLDLWSFYETRNSKLVVKNEIVVDRNSATLGYAKEHVWPLEADHRSICKFESPADPNYKTLRGCFLKSIEAIEKTVSEESATARKQQLYRLGKMLAVTEPPVDELAALVNVRLAGSCRWLTTKEDYTCWKNRVDDKYQIFLLTGNAAMGKSVLSSQVITDLQEIDLKCSYFFFKHGDIQRSSITACLRSLAFQMGSTDEDLLRMLLRLEHLDTSWEAMEEGTLWRKLFMESIFRQIDISSHYWIVDALDECHKPSAFLSLLRKLPQNLKIFITSRQTAELRLSWLNIDPPPFCYDLKEEDTFQDLKSLIDSKMVLSHENDEMKAKLKERILQKASGSFLWVTLVIAELEQAYSAGIVEDVLNEVPADMNKLYERILSRMPQGPRFANFARTILTWTVLSLRPLTVLETQHFVSLDLNDTIFSLDRSFMANCGQLVRIDNCNRIKIMHQTTRKFLLEQKSHPEYAISALTGHPKLAEVCLEFLTGTEFKQIRNRRLTKSPQTANVRHDVANYACTYFSDHLRGGSSEGSKGWSLLCKFFEGSVLSWIEQLASIGKTRHISRSAYNLQSYLSRRIKHLCPLSPEKANIEAWIIDLIRISVKFRQSISTMPSSIFTMIPAMCPSDSMIRRFHSDRVRSITIAGHTDETWDDCLAHVDYHEHQPIAVAYGNQLLAVGLSNGSIILYYWDSIEVKFHMNHEERISLLSTSECGNWIASAGFKKVRVWNARTGERVKTFATKQQALAISFIRGGAALTIATKGNTTITWSLTDDAEQYQWQWKESIRRDGKWTVPHQPPNRALFSHDCTALVVSYRMFPTYLFDMETESFVGCYTREVNYQVDALAFNPNPEINILVASYGDGEIVIYDLWTTEIRFRVHGLFAHHLACSPDGRYLVAASSQGVMQVFIFEGVDGDRISLIYGIDSNEGGIRGIAVSKDSFRIADIRRSRCSVWEPPLLDSGTQEEGSQSDVSQATTLYLKTSASLKQSSRLEITALCCHPDGSILFCGRRDGSVSYTDTETAKSSSKLYSHVTDVTVTSICYRQSRSFLISADEASQILVYKVKTSESSCETVGMIVSVSLRQDTTEPLKSLLVNEDCERFLIQRLTFARIWTEQGRLVGNTLQFDNQGDEKREEAMTIINHPFRADCFLFIKHEEISVYRWSDASEIQHITTEMKGLSLVITPNREPPLLRKPDKSNSSKENQKAEHRYVVDFYRTKTPVLPSRGKSSVLKAWKVNQTSAFEFPPLSLDATMVSELASNIAQILAVDGQMLLFLDVEFWICSIDLAKIAEDALYTPSRHFFLLSEWRFSHKKFLVSYVREKREFVIAKKSDILVIKRGLDNSQSWTPIDPLAAPIQRRDTYDIDELTRATK